MSQAPTQETCIFCDGTGRIMKMIGPALMVKGTCPGCLGTGQIHVPAPSSAAPLERCDACAGRKVLLGEVCDACRGAGRIRTYVFPGAYTGLVVGGPARAASKAPRLGGYGIVPKTLNRKRIPYPAPKGPASPCRTLPEERASHENEPRIHGPSSPCSPARGFSGISGRGDECRPHDPGRDRREESRPWGRPWGVCMATPRCCSACRVLPVADPGLCPLDS